MTVQPRLKKKFLWSVAAALAGVLVCLIAVFLAFPAAFPSVYRKAEVNVVDNAISQKQPQLFDAGVNAGVGLSSEQQKSDKKEGVAYESGHVLVTLADGVSVSTALDVLSQDAMFSGLQLASDDADAYIRFALPEGLSVADALTRLASFDVIERAQPNYYYQLMETTADPVVGDALLARTAALSNVRLVSGTALGSALRKDETIRPNDELYDSQWALENVNAPGAWKYFEQTGLVKQAVQNVSLDPLDSSDSSDLSDPTTPSGPLDSTVPPVPPVPSDPTDPTTLANRPSVAVIDAGFLVTHPDLSDNVVGTYNAVTKREALNSHVGTTAMNHGTHCAGVIAALSDNYIGVSGVTYNTCRVLPIQVEDTWGSISTTYLMNAYRFIIDNQEQYNIRVASVSLGAGSADEVSRSTDPHLYDIIDEAREAGVMTVVAACNTTDNTFRTAPFYAWPADYDNVVSVINLGASKTLDGAERTKTSNYNMPGQKTKAISAPGCDIVGLLSTENMNQYYTSFNDKRSKENPLIGTMYGYMSGTSMSTPLVAGVAAMMFAADPALSVDEATSKLYSTAKDMKYSLGCEVGWDDATGFGEVDAASVVQGDELYLSGSSKVVAGETITLSVKQGRQGLDNTEWEWTSDNETIARVDNGIVTGLTEGQVIVTARNGEQSASQIVAVETMPTDVATLNISVEDQVYSGYACTPAPLVYDRSIRLQLGSNYTLKYTNNVNAGIASVTLIGLAPYYGEVTKTFNISKVPLSNANVQLSATSFVYNGTAQRPSVIVKDIGQNGGKVLNTSNDYTVLFSDALLGTGSAIITAKSSCANFTGSVTQTYSITASPETMYRLYQPASSEHFYTSGVDECQFLVENTWRYEGKGWTAPSYSDTPVYRLYSPYQGDHHYTTNADERDFLVRNGWRYEGVGWYSSQSSGEPLYRMYNPYLKCGQHHYTMSDVERDYLVANGWKYEGIAWYALK